MSAIIQLVGLASGEPTPFDGQYLVEYDPTRPGRSPDGREMLAHVVTTPDPAEARRFADAAEAHGVWTAPSGLPYPRNAPLTAYTIALLPVGVGEEMSPPPCADHRTSELGCPVCTAQRRAFYAALGREDGGEGGNAAGEP